MNKNQKNRRFIFLSDEGFTFQPHSEKIEPDIENLQVVGFASGICADEAFSELLEANPYLTKTSFDEVFCLELREDAGEKREYFYISDIRNLK